MTREEAIEKHIKECRKRILSIKRFMKSDKNADIEGCKENIFVLKNAIEALEKQIPKKPIYEADGYTDGELVYDSAECPNCGHLFEYDINDWESAYCLECGKALDWTEEGE